MRDRQRILTNLEELYRGGFEKAKEKGDQERMERLDFEFQKDQLYLEVMLDVRDLMALPPEPRDGVEAGGSSILDKAQKLRNLTRLR